MIKKQNYYTYVTKILVFLLTVIFTFIFSSTTALAEDGVNNKVESVRKSCVRVRTMIYYKGTNTLITGGYGSGFAIGNGAAIDYIVTNHHVIDPEEAIEQLDKQNIKYTRKIQLIMGRDDYIDLEETAEIDLPITDIAVVKLKKSLNIPPVTFATSENVKLTQRVYAMGYPGAGDAVSFIRTGAVEDLTITEGTISKITEDRTLNGVKIYQTTAAINSGNSGGVLVDTDGNAIGIVVSVAVNQQGIAAQGIGYAIQSDELLPLLDNRGISYKKVSSAGLSSQASTNSQPVGVKSDNKSQTPSAAQNAKPAKNNTMLIIIVAAAGAVLIILLAVIFVLTRRKTPQPSKVAAGGNAVSSVLNNPLNDTFGSNIIHKARTPKLYGISGCFAGTDISLTLEPIIIGRDPRICQLVFPENNTDVGRKHCIIRCNGENGSFMLEDCFSTNGTFMANGERLQPGICRNLKSGERFYLSSSDNMFEVRLE